MDFLPEYFQKWSLVKVKNSDLLGIVMDKKENFLVVQLLSGSTIEARWDYFEPGIVEFEKVG
jgi:hypothetical protein